MVVNIYSLSEWNVELSPELQSYWLSSTSNDDQNDATTTTTTTTLPFSVQEWLHHSIKVSPSITICRYNYCHPTWCDDNLPSDADNVCNEHPMNQNTFLTEQQQQQQQQKSIQSKLKESIQDWLQQRHRQHYRQQHLEHSNNTKNENGDDYTVVVQPHAILNDTISIQIILNTKKTTNALLTVQQEKNGNNNNNDSTSNDYSTYDMYTSHGPPPLHTWFTNNNNNARNDNRQALKPQTPIPSSTNNDMNNTINLEANVCGSTAVQSHGQHNQHDNHYWRKEQNWPPYPYGVVIIDRICGEAILRGADIYPTNGILCTDTYIVPNTPVAIYVDMTSINNTSTADSNHTTKMKKVSRGMTLQEYSTSTIHHRTVIYIGIGIATCTRSEIFTKDIRTKQSSSQSTSNTTTTAAIQMIQIATPTMSYLLPPTNDILSNWDDQIVVQNLPSLLVAHTLLDDTNTTTTDDNSNTIVVSNNIKDEENEIEWILDMCCAPGGKTSHLASLLSRSRNTNGLSNMPTTRTKRSNTTTTRIIACDKSQIKVLQVRDTLKKLHCDDIIIPLVLDTTKCVLPPVVLRNAANSLSKIVAAAETNKDTKLLKINGFPTESFHRILLDPPCSAWGLRPKLSIVQTKIEQLQSVCSYQRQFIHSAIQLLKPGGVMTYSTCTIHTSENETMVRYILDEYPMMELIPIHIPVGGPGWVGFGLNAEECQYVRRFDPTDVSVDDSIGFFVAKFRKKIT